VQRSRRDRPTAGADRQGLIAIAEQRVFPRGDAEAVCGAPGRRGAGGAGGRSPSTQPATLPDDVVAALATLAKFEAAKAAARPPAAPVQLASMQMSSGK
jgi:hypothetical protein